MITSTLPWLLILEGSDDESSIQFTRASIGVHWHDEKLNFCHHHERKMMIHDVVEERRREKFETKFPIGNFPRQQPSTVAISDKLTISNIYVYLWKRWQRRQR